MFPSGSIGRSGADKPPANAIALPPPKRGLTDEQWADIAYCLRVLTDCLAPKHSCRIKKDARPPMELNLHGERAFCVFVRFEGIYSACGFSLNPRFGSTTG